jgi:hypothetical protein
MKNQKKNINDNSENENINLLKSELNKANNLIDYFVVIGINPDICLNDFLYEKDINELNKEDYKNYFKPTILSQFPPFDKSFINIDNGIIPYCFPNGFKIIQKNTIPQIEIFNFILDNNFFSLNFPRKYITCLLFYEGLDKYKELEELILRFEKNSDYYNNNYLKIFKELDLKLEKNINKLNYSHSMKNFKSIYKTELQKFYIPKVICLVSVYPFFSVQKEIIKLIYQYSKIENVIFPIEKILTDIIINIPTPPRGLYQFQYTLLNQKILISDSPMNKLRNIDENIKLIFNIFPHENIYNIFKHILFETKILFFSSNIKLICPIIYGFISLIYPFNYPFQVATFLPKMNYNLLESISPYILGINETYEDNFFEKNNIIIDDLTILIVNLDDGKIELKSNENFPPFPNHYYKKMKELIEKTILKQKKNNVFVPSDEYFSIRNLFFEFLVNLFQNYTNFLSDEYIKCDDTNVSIQKMFKVEKFVLSFPNSDRKFYQLFCDTQTFSDFIYKRLIPNNTQDKIDILFFDESIIKKNNRRALKKKKILNFLTSNEYNYKKVYYYNQTLKDLSNSEIEKIKSNKYSLLKKSQNIKIKNSNEVSFSYPLFPIIDQELYISSKKDYLYPSNTNEELQLINSHIISISHLGNIELSKYEMENYIYLTWIQLWAYSFCYQDQIEKRFLFKQLLIVLDKVYHHEIEVFNLLFEALNKFHEEKMMIKLYEKLISYHLNPSSFIYSIMSIILDKEKLKYEKQLNHCMTVIDGTDDILNFRKRTFKNEYENEVVGNKVVFNFKNQCYECKKKINLIEISKNFKDMKKDDLWAMCPYCKNYLLPKLEVKLGDELNNNFNLEKSTSTIDNFPLFSPFFLKNFINQIPKEKGRVIDINKFRINFTTIFWNCIWYFKLTNLDYNMFLPYENIVYLYNKFWNTNIGKLNVKINFLKKNDVSNIEKNKIEMKGKKKRYFYNKKICIVSKEINFMFLSLENSNFIVGDGGLERRRNSSIKSRRSYILPNDLKENFIDELLLNNEIIDEQDDDVPSPKNKKWNSSLNEILEENNNSNNVENDNIKNITPLNVFNLKKSKLNIEINESDEDEKQ